MLSERDKKIYDKMWEDSPFGKMGCMRPIGFACIFLIFLLFSCATRKEIKYVDRDVVRYVSTVEHDTIVENNYDSVFVSVKQKNDTIFVEKNKIEYKTKNKIVYKTDTCYRDSTKIQIEYKDKIKKVIPNWCYLCLVISLFCIIFAITKVMSWLRKN